MYHTSRRAYAEGSLKIGKKTWREFDSVDSRTKHYRGAGYNARVGHGVSS